MREEQISHFQHLWRRFDLFQTQTKMLYLHASRFETYFKESSQMSAYTLYQILYDMHDTRFAQTNQCQPAGDSRGKRKKSDESIGS
ncbi:hypothetical protein ACSC83_14405 [Bacillus velezensis]|uniref:hypothetical protein n=1 Tax=Bacillus halotolerans TaxID=260554 RepID=UPI0024C11FCE|nr:hypothetical protein [Bacillus halotolerans]WHY23367.1 hypothetical protein QNH41_15285 [Bacillus halotolerans]